MAWMAQAGLRDAALGQARHLDAVPLEGLDPVGEPRKQRVGAAGLGQLDRGDPDFRLCHPPGHAAERDGEQLMAEADAEIGPLQLGHPAPDRGLLGDEPGVLVLLPHVHRPAHHGEHVETLERRDRLAGVELDGRPLEPALRPEVAERARMLDGEMLEHEDPHAASSRNGAASRRGP
jgi:hypothetical protein